MTDNSVDVIMDNIVEDNIKEAGIFDNIQGTDSTQLMMDPDLSGTMTSSVIKDFTSNSSSQSTDVSKISESVNRVSELSDDITSTNDSLPVSSDEVNSPTKSVELQVNAVVTTTDNDLDSLQNVGLLPQSDTSESNLESNLDNLESNNLNVAKLDVKPSCFSEIDNSDDGNTEAETKCDILETLDVDICAAEIRLKATEDNFEVTERSCASDSSQLQSIPTNSDCNDISNEISTITSSLQELSPDHSIEENNCIAPATSDYLDDLKLAASVSPATQQNQNILENCVSLDGNPLNSLENVADSSISRESLETTEDSKSLDDNFIKDSALNPIDQANNKQVSEEVIDSNTIADVESNISSSMQIDKSSFDDSLVSSSTDDTSYFLKQKEAIAKELAELDKIDREEGEVDDDEEDEEVENEELGEDNSHQDKSLEYDETSTKLQIENMIASIRKRKNSSSDRQLYPSKKSKVCSDEGLQSAEEEDYESRERRLSFEDRNGASSRASDEKQVRLFNLVTSK